MRESDRMGSSIKAININPEILKWARETSGFAVETIAKRINVSKEQLEEIEKGDHPLTVAKLRNLAEFYNRPTAIFYLDEVPKSDQFPDFRKTRRNPPIIRSDESLDIKIRKIKEFRKFAIEIQEKMDKPLNYSFIDEFSLGNLSKTLEMSDSTREKISLRIREKLGIKTTDLAGKRDNEVLNYWKSKIEALKILIFQFQRIDPSIARGFVFAETPFPTIALNQKDSIYARIFTLIHEFLHILLQSSGLCDAQVFDISKITEETISNKLAASILIPASELREKFLNLNTHIDEEKITELSQHFRVSYSVVLFRLKNLNLINEPLFRKLKSWINSIPTQGGKSKGGDFYTLYLSKTSKLYLTLVLTALDQEKIEYHEALTYVGQKVDVFEKITNYFERLVWGV